jgi:exoribonuclease R
MPNSLAAAPNRHPGAMDRSPWLHASFLNNTRIRVRERYWQDISTMRQASTRSQVSARQDNNNDKSKAEQLAVRYCVFPDAVTLRKYLPLLKDLFQAPALIQGEAGVNLDRNNLQMLQWVLLESVVEYMDHRNQSPVVSTTMSESNNAILVQEKAASQERNKLQRWMQERRMHVFCDLSVRGSDSELGGSYAAGTDEAHQDEFDWMRYAQRTISERSQHSLYRAARLWQQLMRYTDDTVTNVIIWSDGPKPQVEDDARVVNMAEFIALLEQNNVLSLERGSNLIDLMHICEEEYDRRHVRSNQDAESDTEYVCEYLPQDKVESGLQQGSLFRGRLVISSENASEAYVKVNVPGKSAVSYFVDIHCHHNNRAIHYDIVAIEPLPESQWGRPVGRKRLVFHRDDNDTDGSVSLVSDNQVADGPAVPSARVVAVVNPTRRTFVATLLDAPQNDNERAVLVVPMDIKIPKIRIRSQSWRNFCGKRLWVQIDEWDVTSFYPQGRCLEIIGPIGDLETEVMCLLREQQVDLEPFSVAALACLPPEADEWKVIPRHVKERRDLRESHRIFSVDPPGCQDIDDTMHAKTLSNGDIESKFV